MTVALHALPDAVPAEDHTEPTERLLTLADAAALPDQLPSGPFLFELEEGKLVLMSPGIALHGGSLARLVQVLGNAAYAVGGQGFCGEIGLVLGHGPDTLYGRDAVYFAPTSLPLRYSPEGYIETPADLVAEVRGKGRRPGRMATKVARYLAAGVKEVWDVDPAGVEPRRYAADETLTTDVIPGVPFPLAKLFRQS